MLIGNLHMMPIYYLLFPLLFSYGDWTFFPGAIDELKDKNSGMMILIGSAVLVAYLCSLLTIFGLEGSDFF